MISATLRGAKARLAIVGVVGLLAGMFLGMPFVAAQRPAAIKAEIMCLPSAVAAWETHSHIIGNSLTRDARTGWQLVAITSFQQPSSPGPCVMFVSRRS